MSKGNTTEPQVLKRYGWLWPIVGGVVGFVVSIATAAYYIGERESRNDQTIQHHTSQLQAHEQQLDQLTASDKALGKEVSELKQNLAADLAAIKTDLAWLRQAQEKMMNQQSKRN